MTEDTSENRVVRLGDHRYAIATWRPRQRQWQWPTGAPGGYVCAATLDRLIAEQTWDGGPRIYRTRREAEAVVAGTDDPACRACGGLTHAGVCMECGRRLDAPDDPYDPQHS